MKKRLLLTDPKLVIYDPATGQRVPPEGILADPRADFWHRRLREGDMVVAPAPAAPKARPYVRGPGTHDEFVAESKPRHLMTEPPKEA